MSHEPTDRPVKPLDIRQGGILTEAVAGLQNIISYDREDRWIHSKSVFEVRRDYIISVAEHLTDLIGNLDEPLNSLARLIRHPDTDLDIALNSIAMVYNEQPDGFNKLVLEDAMELICVVIDEINHPVQPTKKQNILAKIVNGQKEGVSILGGYVTTPAAVERTVDLDETYAQIRLGIEGTDYILSLREADE